MTGGGRRLSEVEFLFSEQRRRGEDQSWRIIQLMLVFVR